jgi:hypothetical protein
MFEQTADRRPQTADSRQRRQRESVWRERSAASEKSKHIKSEKKNKKECGGEKVGKRVGKACRPLHRITKDTPITISELLNIHSKEDILHVAKQKERHPEKRVVWKTLQIQ